MLSHSPARNLLIVDIEDSEGPNGDKIGALTYEDLLAEGDPEFAYALPEDEWDALALNYTSGTTGAAQGRGLFRIPPLHEARKRWDEQRFPVGCPDVPQWMEVDNTDSDDDVPF